MASSVSFSSSISLHSIRHTTLGLANSSCRHLRSTIVNQRRRARVHDVRFVTTQRNSQQILDRYKEKLEQKAKEEGHQSLAELKKAYEDKIQDLKRKASTPLPGQGQEQSHTKTVGLQQPPPPAPSPPLQLSSEQTANAVRTTPSIGPASADRSSSAAPGIKSLSSYLDIEKVRSLPYKEIEYIWRLRHANDPLSLCAVIPLQTYERIHKTAKQHPQFILPLPRPAAEDSNQPPSASGNDGQTAADIHFLQWGFYPPAGLPPSPGLKTANTHTSSVIFTHLAAFKVHGSFAQPHTVVTHHLDLADSHNIVLLNGSVTENRGVSVEEARWLLMCLQKFYDFEGHGGGIGKEKRQGLLEKFNRGDEGFNLEELVDEAERIS